MKFLFLFYIALLFITMHSCNNNAVDTQATNKVRGNESIALIGQSDSLINLSLETLLKIQANSYNNKPSNEEDLVNAKAAVARFYGNLIIVDKHLSSKSKTGQEIGLNEDVFTFFNKGIMQINVEIEKMDDYSHEQLKRDIETQVSQLLAEKK